MTRAEATAVLSLMCHPPLMRDVDGSVRQLKAKLIAYQGPYSWSRSRLTYDPTIFGGGPNWALGADRKLARTVLRLVGA